MDKIIKITDIQEKDLPLIVLADDLRGFIGWWIKAHCKGNYSHVMLMRRIGFFASQNWLYREIPVEKYLKPRYILKFWKIKEITEDEKVLLNSNVDKALKENWFRRSYDILGILGQFLRLRWINNPFKRYCSERVAEDLRLVSSIKDLFSRHLHPAEINMVCNLNPDKFECLGYLIDNG